MFRKIITISLAVAAGIAVHARELGPTSALMPMPASVVMPSGKALSVSDAAIVRSTLPSDHRLLSVYGEIMTRHFGDGAGVDAYIGVDTTMTGSEHYRLEVDSVSLRLCGASEEALFRGLQTLDQLLWGDAVMTAGGQVSPIIIDDAPAYPRRALMLDPARHFLPVDDVKRFIDVMASYKYNVLQLHLTDDEGWRVAIEGHPELTEGTDHYTASDIADLIDYAAQRYIEIVPEADIPGHTSAVLGVHPGLGCHIADSAALASAPGNGVMVCAANDSVYALYDDVIRSIASMFTSPYIHLGGDEAAIERNWALCADCRRMMSERGYTDAAQLMNDFFGRMLATVRSCGKKAILWCELDNIYMPAEKYLMEYPADVTLVTWRNGLTPKCIELAAAHGNPLLMAPGEHAYLDYPQMRGDLPEHNNWGMPVTTLRQAYAIGMPSAANVTGVMGTLWGEAINDINRAFYMAYPRAMALAEAGWTPESRRSWDSFRRRLPGALGRLMERGVSFRVPFESFDR
ncbi:beta-N-acetylhexosaminidase [Paramuribaculum intestinale]|uniref:beta-N-acetylhexosaminidase n=1 Tax=Paramuribaculum intestinale TaxID=2094151 RepID=UPI0025A63ECB|nr:family 20 glycosylhydrolase [Paramuribaculum intestinale]